MRSLEAPTFGATIVKESSPSQNYRLKDSSKVDALVNGIVENIENGNSGFPDPNELVRLSSSFDAKKAAANLPEGMDMDDLAGIFMIAMLTEAATDTYSRDIVQSSDAFRAVGGGFLRKFNDLAWNPDEQTHHLPHKGALMGMGYSEEELDREIQAARERDYLHVAGLSPAGMATFGMIQEYGTVEFYNGEIDSIKKGNPETAESLVIVRRREGVHTGWYKDMLTFQIEDTPENIVEAAYVTDNFVMPDEEIAPHLHPNGDRYMALMGRDLSRMRREGLRLINQAADSPATMGRFVLEMAKMHDVRIAGIRPEWIIKAFNKFKSIGGPGYGIFAESLLKAAGMGEPFKAQESDPLHRPVDYTRGKITDMFAKKIGSEI